MKSVLLGLTLASSAFGIGVDFDCSGYFFLKSDIDRTYWEVVRDIQELEKNPDVQFYENDKGQRTRVSQDRLLQIEDIFRGRFPVRLNRAAVVTFYKDPENSTKIRRWLYEASSFWVIYRYQESMRGESILN